MRRFAVLVTIFGVMAGFLAVYSYLARFELEARGGEEVEILIATQDIQEGTELTVELLGVRAVPGRFVEARHVRANQLERILGVRATSLVRSNETVLWNDLSSTLIGPRSLSQYLQSGMRALTVQGASQGILTPGDRVDIQHTSGVNIADRRGVQTRVIVQNVIVLASGPQIGPLLPGQEPLYQRYNYGGVTVAVMPRQAGFLTLAQEDGQLSFLARSPGDPNRIDTDDALTPDGLPGREINPDNPVYRAPASGPSLPVDFSR